MLLAKCQTLLCSTKGLIEGHPSIAILLLLLCAVVDGLPILALLMPVFCLPLLVAFILNIGVTPVVLFFVVWVGLVFAYGISYWIGRYYLPFFKKIWPLSTRPQLLAYGHRFFERWGVLGVIISPFIKPLRASIPVAAGCCGMPLHRFLLGNLLGCGVNAFWILLLAYYGGQACLGMAQILGRLWG